MQFNTMPVCTNDGKRCRRGVAGCPPLEGAVRNEVRTRGRLSPLLNLSAYPESELPGKRLSSILNA
ncbi:hypothetical protein [Treponema socranskii]|uniref:hypothetical protein n=1 Tax=Treponema socranskii TaxID=53419 RepID=UPI003D8E1EF8